MYAFIVSIISVFCLNLYSFCSYGFLFSISLSMYIIKSESFHPSGKSLQSSIDELLLFECFFFSTGRDEFLTSLKPLCFLSKGTTESPRNLDFLSFNS